MTRVSGLYEEVLSSILFCYHLLSPEKNTEDKDICADEMALHHSAGTRGWQGWMGKHLHPHPPTIFQLGKKEVWIAWNSALFP